MKKAVIYLMIVTLLAMVFYSTSLFISTPPKAEAMYVNFWLLIEIMCDECQGQWSKCCHKPCYEKYVYGTHTSNYSETSKLYEECLVECATDLSRGCNSL